MMKPVITVTYKIHCVLFLRTACKSYVIEIQSFIASLCVCVHLVLLSLFTFKPNYICILDPLCLCVCGTSIQSQQSCDFLWQEEEKLLNENTFCLSSWFLLESCGQTQTNTHSHSLTLHTCIVQCSMCSSSFQAIHFSLHHILIEFWRD